MAMLIIFGSPDGAGRFDNMEKGARVETRAADQKAVNIVLFHEFGGVFRLHTAAVKDAEVGSLGPEQVGEDGADFVMDLVGLFRGGHLAGANGPDGLVGDDQLGDLLLGKALQGATHLGLDHGHGFLGLALGEGFPHADDGPQVIADGGHRLGGHGGIGFVEKLATLRVAEDDVADPELAEHRAGDLAGEGALLGLMHVLGAHGENAVAAEGFGGGGQRGEGRADDHVDVGDFLDALNDVLDEVFGVGGGAVHLPVAGNEGAPGNDCLWLAHWSLREATPGRVLPSRNSSEAPPPVEIKVTCLPTPAFFTAFTESPPPMMETALGLAATALAMAKVPSAQAGISKTPIGPFQRMVPAPAISLA